MKSRHTPESFPRLLPRKYLTEPWHGPLQPIFRRFIGVKRIDRYTFDGFDAFERRPEISCITGSLLFEHEVLDAVRKVLATEGWTVTQQCAETQHGTDLIAKKSGRTLFLEGKGGTSSNPSSSRYGDPFSDPQVQSHIGRAMAQCSKCMTENPNAAIGLALPEEYFHLKHLYRSREVVFRMGINVLLVDYHQRNVREWF